MPKITPRQIEWLPADRQIFSEVSPGITTTEFANLFSSTIQCGDTTRWYKFLDEISEKDPDIIAALATRSSQITSKEWFIEGPNEQIALEIEERLRTIKGSAERGLISVDGLLATFLGSSYLTGISISEIVTDDKEIIGFNPVPHHFITFQDSVYYPKLWTQEEPTGKDFNREKMIVHYLNPGIDPVRGWLGHSIGWQYVLKASAQEQRLLWQRRYGKGFLLVNMPGERDSYDAAWSTAESLVDNLYNVDGAVFPSGVEAEMIGSDSLEGEYFFNSRDEYKNNIMRIILGQESTTSSESSNRSTAEVHKDILETRVLEDIELIQDTLTNALIPKVKQLMGVSSEEQYEFKMVVSNLEEEIKNEESGEENDTRQTQETSQAGDSRSEGDS